MSAQRKSRAPKTAGTLQLQKRRGGRRQVVIIVGIFLIIGVVGIGAWFFGKKSPIPTSMVLQSINRAVPPTPEPVTIPGLRQTQVEPTTLDIISSYGPDIDHIQYRAAFTSQGLRQYGLLTVPTTPPPPGGYPVIIFLHGYVPPDMYVTNERYVAYVRYFAARGFAVFKIDYRGHDQSEGNAEGAYFSPGYVMDVRAAITAIQSDPRFNPNAIGVWAHSMSGNIALRASVVDPRIKAVVIWAGAVYSYQDMADYGIDDRSYVRNKPDEHFTSRAAELTEKYGSIGTPNEFWQTIAPSNYLADLQAPVQLHHAEDDKVVVIEYSEDLVAAAQQAGASVTLFRYPVGNHNIEEPSFSTAIERSRAFFKEELGSK